MELLKLAQVEDIPSGKAIVVQGPEGIDLAVFHVDGNFFALENACPHMGGPLGEGDLDNCVITCPWHGWEFDVRTGFCLNMPGEDAQVWPLQVIGNEIFLQLPEAVDS